MIDLHCHVLPGIDDGPATMEESVALARAASESGVETIVATPHVSWGYPNEAQAIAAGVDALNQRLAAEGVPVHVRRGAEIACTLVSEIDSEELAGLALGDGSWLLIEPPFTPSVTGLEGLLQRIQERGHGVVLAHPERCPGFHRDPAALRRLVNGGMLCSITAGSLVGRFGGPARRFARDLVRNELVHNVASDAHDHSRRPPGMRAEMEQAGLDHLTAWALDDVPAALLAGAPVPDRPPHPPATTRRRSWRRHR